MNVLFLRKSRRKDNSFRRLEERTERRIIKWVRITQRKWGAGRVGSTWFEQE